MAESWKINTARDDPLFGPQSMLYFLLDLNEAAGPAMGRIKRGEIGPYPRLASEKRAPYIADVRSAISGSPCWDHGQSPPRQATHVAADPRPRAVISAGVPPISGAIPRSRWPGACVGKKRGVKSSLASRTARKAGPVKWSGDVRDFLLTLEDSWPVAAAPDDPL